MDYEKKIKELSIKQKAQRYNDAIARANELLYVSDKESLQRKTIESIFPELKESEDEKVRKQIISFLKEFEYDCYRNLDFSSWIAWLEKQGEPVEINPTEFDTRLQTLIGKFDSLPKEELIGSLSFWLNVVQNNGTYKPAKKQGKQKPADWSEEDECCINQLIIFCENCMQQDSEAIRCANWLKSLKDRYTWKPSEEQMKALNYVVNLMASCASPKYNDYYYNVFKNLRKQLKELMKG